MTDIQRPESAGPRPAFSGFPAPALALELPDTRVVLGVDPGETTGWCLVNYEPENKNKVPVVVAYGQTPTWKALPHMIHRPVVDHVVIENFRLRKDLGPTQIGSEFIACQVIGVVRYLCEVAGIEYTLKPAGDKEFFRRNTGRLRELGFVPSDYKLHEGRHALDAIAHTLHYLHFSLGIRYD